MAVTKARLSGPALLTATDATQYTSPANTKTVIRQIHVNNVTGAAASFFASIGADAAATELFTGMAISANSVYDGYGLHVLNAGETFNAHSGTASALNLTLYGEQYTLG